MRWLSRRSNSAREEIASTSLSASPLLISTSIQVATVDKGQLLLQCANKRQVDARALGGGQRLSVDVVQFQRAFFDKVVVHARQVIRHAVGRGQQLVGEYFRNDITTSSSALNHFLHDRQNQCAGFSVSH